ncbi:MAG: alanine racemase [Bacteroidetes bacterium]|nr:alanine racemase [Bacteroidota bacterium]
MSSSSTIEISNSAYLANLSFIRHLIGENVRFSSVVKGNAYGHGVEQIVPIAEKTGVDHFSVFSSLEARQVKKVASDDVTVMIMGFISDEDLHWVIDNNIEFFVSDPERIEKMLRVCRNKACMANIHLEIETGMNRTGLKFKELQDLLILLKKNKEYFNVKGLCTHYAGAESIANYVRIQKQIKRFKEIDRYLADHGINPEIRHTASSASAITYPQTRMDMVRIGILQYGFWPSRETFIHYIHDKTNKRDPLRRVLKWKSEVMSVKRVKQGEFIGYGNNYQAYKSMKIAIIPVGYCDGYSRNLSNQGKVLINNERISIIGMVNMNMIIANVSKLPDVKVGDEVVIIGKQGTHQLSVASFSELSNQVNYELLTRLPDKIHRQKK